VAGGTRTLCFAGTRAVAWGGPVLTTRTMMPSPTPLSTSGARGIWSGGDEGVVRGVSAFDERYHGKY
jgi:hypothetical protein